MTEIQLAEECLTHILAQRARAERTSDAPVARFAGELLASGDLGPDGPAHLRRALDAAAGLFRGHGARPDPGTAAAAQVLERVETTTFHLVEGARALLNDPAFEPYIHPWIKHLFDPATLLQRAVQQAGTKSRRR